MNKLTLTVCFYLTFLLLSSCERSDYTDDIRETYRQADKEINDNDSDNNNNDNDYADSDSDSGDTDIEPDSAPPEPEPEPVPTEDCTLDTNILTGDSEHYFSFKGVGIINISDTSNPDWANLVKVALVGIKDKDLDYANLYSFFISTTTTDPDPDGGEIDIPAVEIEALGDPNMSTGYFTTIAFADLPIDYIDLLKEYEEELNGVLPAAPVTRIIDLIYTSDLKYLKQCTIAESKLGMVKKFGKKMPAGKTQICYHNNQSFDAGETFELAMYAELVTGQELIDMYSDVNSADDFCTCYEADDYIEVDCSTIDESETEPTVVCAPEEHKVVNESGNECICMTGYYDDGYGCVSPCDPNHCTDTAYSTGKCTVTGNKSYSCECKTGSEWNGLECAVVQ